MLGVVVASALAAPAAMGTVVAPASQPPQPPAGVPGGDGACTVVTRSIPNPRHAEGAEPMPVWIFEPAGDAAATVTGGRCDGASRPAIFLAHGFGQTNPAAYQALVHHLVSVGNIVVYPTYTTNDGKRSTLEENYRAVDAGIVAAVADTPRVDTARVGWWGHSHGGGMVPWLVQQGAARRWGGKALWMSMVAQAYTQLVGDGDIAAPRNAQAMTIAFEHDAAADARLGIDVFQSLLLPLAQKRHITVNTDIHGQPPLVADHGAPSGGNGAGVDALDFLVFRYGDVLETCALFRKGCAGDLSTVGVWSDGTPVVPAIVTAQPVDVGPYPAALAECDAVYGGPNVADAGVVGGLNPRAARCGATHL